MPDFIRKRLRHGIPEWVCDGATYFLTVNAARRGVNVLANVSMGRTLKDSIQVYTDQLKWYPKLVVIMPDHLHMLISLNTAQFTIRQIVSPWKGYLHRTHQIEWQEGFFDHRIRNHASLDEKEAYLRMNPVRAGFVKKTEDWPYIWGESDFSDKR